LNKELTMVGVMTKVSILLAVLVCALSSAQAEVYRWTDKDGKVHYSDNPPPDAKVEQRKLSDSNVGDAGESYETKRAAQVAPVTLYVAPDCKDVCDKARKLLSTRKVPFSESKIETQEQLDALASLVGKKSPMAPTLVVGRKPIEGFEAGAWNAALDVVGYPKAP
jgi:glutaredoxin